MSGYLPGGWFAADVASVARGLVGRWLTVGASTRALILETEAYGGADDPASHAAFRPGGRAAIMAGEAGVVYVYAAYGMYPCFNIVTGVAGTGSAVLLRAVFLPEERRSVNGPGRTSRALGITLDDHGTHLPGSRFAVSVEREPCFIRQTRRIGITRGIETPWRFVGQPMMGGC